MSEWKGPVGWDNWKGFILSWAVVLVVIFLARRYLFGDDHFLVTLGAFAILVFLDIMIYIDHRPVWDFVYSSHKREGVLGTVEAALGDADLEFTRRGPIRSRRWRSERWFLDLGATQVIVEEGPGPTTVYVGPVSDVDQKDVERLKGLVDGALG